MAEFKAYEKDGGAEGKDEEEEEDDDDDDDDDMGAGPVDSDSDGGGDRDDEDLSAKAKKKRKWDRLNARKRTRKLVCLARRTPGSGKRMLVVVPKFSIRFPVTLMRRWHITLIGGSICSLGGREEGGKDL